MENINNNIALNEDVSSFADTALEFCMLIENIDQFSKHDFIFKIRNLLPHLYYKITLIPQNDPLSNEELEKFVTQGDWEYMNDKLLEKFGQHNTYLEVFDPTMQDQEGPVTRSIAEDLTDIYQDLKNFITSYGLGNEEVMYDSLWECLENFRSFWGQRLTNALRAIHYLCSSDEELSDELNDYKAKDDIDETDVDTSNWLLDKKLKNFDLNG